MQANERANQPRFSLANSACLPALLLAGLGITVILVGRGYPQGTLTAMGPGFLPVLLGSVLLLLALPLLWRAAPQSLPAVPWRPVVCVASGMLAWAVLAEPLGFFPAAWAQIALSAFALPQAERRKDLLVALLLSIGAWLLFVRALGLPLPAFGR